MAAWLVWRSVPVFPPELTLESRCSGPVQNWSADRPLKVLSFNVQYMAGKNYVFYYDVEGGPDTHPSSGHVQQTIGVVADLIRQQDPDLVLLQEVNDAADSRTHYIDQLGELQRALADSHYPCVASAFYWKAGWVPHPKVLGPVSMQLVTLSRYRLASVVRYQLPLMDNDFVTRHFYFQRALLETRLDDGNGNVVAVLNTHLEAWGKGSDVLSRQVNRIMQRLRSLDAENVPWVMGGDFNLLPPDGGRQWQRLQDIYDRPTPLAPLYSNYGAIPSLDNLTGATAARWYTHFPNDPDKKAPDRTIDYLFYSADWRLLGSRVMQDRLDISDHLPVEASLRLLN